MSTADDVAAIRMMVAESENTQPYTDEAIAALIPQYSSLNKVAAQIWRNKAAALAKLVDISEAGSSRSMSQLYDNAVAMANMYDGLDAAHLTQSASATTTRRIVRASR